MPKIAKIERAKIALEQELRETCSRNGYSPELIPSLRELSERHGLSKSLAQRVVRAFCNEGLLFPVHGMGTFAGRRPTLAEQVFLFLYEDGARSDAIRQGFEERISALGAISISLPMTQVAHQWFQGHLPQVQGVWDPSFDADLMMNLAPDMGVPVTGLLGRVNPARSDAVFFDDFQGGKTATQHLLAFGMRSALFLGVHAQDAPYGALEWSARRAEGFKSAMTSVGLEAFARILAPPHAPTIHRESDPYDYFAMGAMLAKEFSAFDKNLGIVAANDRVAYGFIAAALQAGVAPELIPPFIGFDNLETNVGSYLSSMALPWDELGRMAADVLFRRVSGALTPLPISELVAMIPITRLSSRRGWLVRTKSLLEALRDGCTESDLF